MFAIYRFLLAGFSTFGFANRGQLLLAYDKRRLSVFGGLVAGFDTAPELYGKNSDHIRMDKLEIDASLLYRTRKRSSWFAFCLRDWLKATCTNRTRFVASAITDYWRMFNK